MLRIEFERVFITPPKPISNKLKISYFTSIIVNKLIIIIYSYCAK